jgi:hypothetical protein
VAQRNPEHLAFSNQRSIDRPPGITSSLLQIVIARQNGSLEDPDFRAKGIGEGSHALFIFIRFASPELVVNVYDDNAETHSSRNPMQHMKQNNRIGSARDGHAQPCTGRGTVMARDECGNTIEQRVLQ